jgi:hypothetical protein
MVNDLGGAIAILMVASSVWSVVKILHRMGLSGWWVLLMGLWPIMLPILAYCRWPTLDKDAN